MKICEGLHLYKDGGQHWIQFMGENNSTSSFNLDELAMTGMRFTGVLLNWAKDMLDQENYEANKERLAEISEDKAPCAGQNHERSIEIILPLGFMNIAVTVNNTLVADTNDSSDWDSLSFPLPDGQWSIRLVMGKVVTLTSKQPENNAKLAGFTEKPIWSGCITKKELTEHRVTIPINIGDERNDNRMGDFLNALDALVSYFQSKTEEDDDVWAALLVLHAERLGQIK